MRPANAIVAGLSAMVLLGLMSTTSIADETSASQESTTTAAAEQQQAPEAVAQNTDAAVAPQNVPNRGTELKFSNPNDPIELQYFRAHDIRGLNVFEAPKEDAVPFTGKKLVWGFGFTQQFQGLRHENSALPKPVTVNNQTVNANELVDIGYGFNNASANLYIDAQLARGMRVAMTAYLSSRHHQEAWVKDGYFQIDASPINHPALNKLMEYTTLRIGHFEVNYGDQHFRRSDNGNAFFNPFVGNLLLDAFTTEIGADIMLRKAGFLALAGLTGGEIRGQVQRPDERSPSYLAKVGFDRQLAQDLRVRLTGSGYINRRAVNSTLYTGSRAGSRYYSVLENTQSTETAQAWSGDIQPGFRNKVAAWVVNPFVKFHGTEFFGAVEQAKGRGATETSQRLWRQYSGELVQRFYQEQLYVGGRYNRAQGGLTGITGDVQVERVQAAAGWFLTGNVLLKGEYVRENYMDFPANDIRSGGRFDGFMVEGVVTF
jgi:hypothetical protein